MAYVQDDEMIAFVTVLFSFGLASAMFIAVLLTVMLGSRLSQIHLHSPEMVRQFFVDHAPYAWLAIGMWFSVFLGLLSFVAQ